MKDESYVYLCEVCDFLGEQEKIHYVATEQEKE